MRPRFALALLVLASCRPAPSPGSIAPLARPPVKQLASCAAPPGEEKLSFQITDVVACVHVSDLRAASYGPPSPEPARGVTWLRGVDRGGRNAVLLHLGEAGELSPLPLPFQPFAAAIAGDRIRIARGRTSEGPATWASIDVSSPDAPRLGPVETIDNFPEKSWMEVLVPGDRFVLLGVRALDPPASPLVIGRWSVATRRREAEISLGAEDRIGGGWCIDAGCALLAMTDAGFEVLALPSAGGSRRRVVAARRDRVVIAPTPTGGLLVVNADDPPRLAMQPIDALGEPAGEPLSIALPAPSDSLQVIHGDGRSLVVLRTRKPKTSAWSLVEIAPDGRSLGPLRPLDLRGESFVSGALGEAGALFVGQTSEVSYDDAGEYHFHSWSATVTAAFDAPGAPSAPRRLLDLAGEGRGGFVGFPIVRGARASAVLIPGGDAYPQETRLVPVRVPCE